MLNVSLKELVSCLQREEWPEAIRMAKILREEGVDAPWLDVCFAAEFRHKSQLQEALHAAERALKADPSNRVAASLRASAAQEMGQKNLAEVFIEGDDVSPTIRHLLRARAAFDATDYPRTRVEAVRFLSEVPSSLEAQSLLHAARWIGNKTKESRKELERLFEEQHSIQAGFKLFFGLYLNGDVSAAIKVLSQCIDLDPTDPWPRLRLIGVYEETGKIEQALIAYQETPSEFRDLPFTQLNYARLLALSGKLGEAERLCWKLFRGSPEDMRFFRVLTWVLRKRRMWHKWVYAIGLFMWLTRDTTKRLKTETEKQA